VFSEIFPFLLQIANPILHFREKNSGTVKVRAFLGHSRSKWFRHLWPGFHRQMGLVDVPTADESGIVCRTPRVVLSQPYFQNDEKLKVDSKQVSAMCRSVEIDGQGHAG
jgi:hypothetical protein